MNFFSFVALLLFSGASALNNGLARTPPMGWSSWNTFACNISEALIVETADALINSGMRDAGYVYVNIDDCWSLRSRNSTGFLVADPQKFPHGMTWIANYLHSRGLKFGLYNAAGVLTCQGYPGSYRFEKQDANLFASWGVDYFKQDWCFIDVGQDPMISYPVMRDALNATGRPIVFSLCEYGLKDVWKWGQATGNLWRTTNDISDSFARWTYILERQDGLAQYAGPGGWNDMDMLVVGLSKQTPEEYKAHFSLWALLASPLIAGNDVRQMKPYVREILTNAEVIAINQDELGIEAIRIWKSFLGECDIWARPIVGGYAAVLFNRDSAKAHKITLSFKDLPVSLSPSRTPVSSAVVRDLWTHNDLGVFSSSFSANVGIRSVVMIRITPK